MSNFCVAYILIIGVNKITLVSLNSILLSIKKSVIYEPLSVYTKFRIVEKPTFNSNAFQAFGLIDLDTARLMVFETDGKLLGTYDLNFIGSTIGLNPL